ncbi:RagB/SusD family nutrient uptake outer membrane protein [Dinghuibacter silviterrae]|uniref:SusD-like starch-binding protein associating with outer membrane n=1 Tax=Dinghuibacter silviterrae TaxID=1539049 RepID=A0A4R8DGX0_9BACT|nr:RagB/SusD family nutrient uptake outer membrane protein [Dinghuibacter silviterrae]TDW96929.1 SusD-like starch-binding protein associating with outer membrane [Dinghuibacter silviterrae]
MKKTIYHISLLSLPGLLLLFGAGCQKLDENPKGSLTPGQYFKTQADLDASVAAIYTELTPDYAFGFTSRMTSCFGADDLTTDPALNKGPFREFDELNGTSTNTSMLNQWQGPWAAVYQANNVLANYQQVQTTEQDKEQAAGQALFLRAFSYYYLVRVFGPVPVILGPLDANARPQRDSVSKVYAAIVSDLQVAIAWLPTTFPNQPGKATANAARSLLADVYLTMTGWPLKQTSYYALAAAEADTVINSNQYTLVPDYLKVFTTNNSTESIFGLQFNVAGGVPDRTYGNSCVPLDEVALNGASGWDDYYPEINFYLNRPQCLRSHETFYDTIKLIQPDKSYIFVPWNSSQTHAGHPYYRKFRAGVGDGVVETNTAIMSMSPSTNKVIDFIRYPMVLLDYAEAATMAGGGPTPAAYAAINQVRARAGEPALTTGLSQAAFQDSCVFERAYEFAGENGVRWFDIVRLQLLPQVIAARSPLENPINSSVDINTRYLSPIPQSDMNNDPLWQQNPGY